MNLDKISVNTRKHMITVILWMGFFAAGFIWCMIFQLNYVMDHVEEALGEALDKNRACINYDYLDFEKINKQYPNLNITDPINSS